MSKIRFGVRQQIFTGFFVVILVFIINVSFTIYYNQRNSRIAQRNAQVVNPSKDAIDKFKSMVLNSEKLITNWVYLMSNDKDKTELRKLHTMRFPALRENINRLKKKWESEEQKQMMDTIIKDFSVLLDKQKTIMNDLVSFEDYEDPVKKFTNQDRLETEILPRTREIRAELEKLSELKNEEVVESQENLIASFERMDQIVLTLFVVILVLGVTAAFITARRIRRPLKILQDAINKLSKGNLPEKEEHNFGNNEIGEMASSVDNLVEGLQETSGFAEQIGNGHLDAHFEPLSEEDVLGNSLLSMRENLKKVAEEDRKRSWSTEGVAKFSEILRQNTDDIKTMSRQAITELVNYMEINQGALFIRRKERDEQTNAITEDYLYNAATYAWDREKFIEERVYKGDGLVGQSWQEMDTLNITEVPDNFIRITSGTGQATPKAILIVPMIINEEVFGVIELADFSVFEQYQVDFVQKIAESIASSLNTVKVNEQTSQLLEESQEMTEQMKAQEEEMRQNMEELQATQEEMERKSQEMQEELDKAQKGERLAKEEKMDVENTLRIYKAELEKCQEKNS